MDKVKNKTGFPPRENRPRVAQQVILPAAVKQRILGEFITGSPAPNNLGSGVSATITVPSGASRSALITTSDNFNRTIMTSPDVAIYVGSISEATQWPNASQNMGNFPVSVFNDWGLTNNVNSVTRVQMYNNTGGSLDVIVAARIRLIKNPVAGGDSPNV